MIHTRIDWWITRFLTDMHRRPQIDSTKLSTSATASTSIVSDPEDRYSNLETESDHRLASGFNDARTNK
jgi:hypothetical protein